MMNVHLWLDICETCTFFFFYVIRSLNLVEMEKILTISMITCKNVVAEGTVCAVAVIFSNVVLLKDQK